MKHKTLCLILLGYSALLWAQQDTSQAVFTLFPSKGSVSEPKFSSFCPDRCWLGEQEFDLGTFRFVDKDSASCIPASARPEGERWVNPVPQPNWWLDDPYDTRYLWRYNYLRDTKSPWESAVDTMVLWRYDRRTSRQTKFFSLPRGELTLGKPGVWVNNRQEMVLLDRSSGKVLNRTDKLEEGWTFSNLRPWGEDVLVGGKWLYQREADRFVPFFPLPRDLEGCKSPDKLFFHGELCSSRVLVENNAYAYYLFAPEGKPVQMPLKGDCYVQDFILAVKSPLVWLAFPNKLLALNYSTGDSLVYEGPTGEPLIGSQQGRFLGFKSEKGLSFFDRYTCAFRVRNLPYGYTKPRYFTSDDRFIYLTYEDHWEILRFDRLETAFNHSSVLEEYQEYKSERDTLMKYLPEGFYAQYDAFIALRDHYKDRNNTKIERDWSYLWNRLSYQLYRAPDSMMERVALDYAANRFDPAINCEIVQGLLWYWGMTGDLQKITALLSPEKNLACVEFKIQEWWQIESVLKLTQNRLDSISKLNIPPDERLYATGNVWLDYCLNKRLFKYTFDPRPNVEQAFDYYRTLLQQYPKSAWADNAAYDMLYYVDFQRTSTDDNTPNSDINQAYILFKKFLKDYPDSDRKPDVLLRLSRAILRGVEDENHSTVPIDEAAQYLREIAQDYPDFARNNDRYPSTVGFLNAQYWSLHWSLEVAFQQDTFRNRDSILLNIKLLNLSSEPQTLDSVFFSCWDEGLWLQLYPIRGADCDQISGSFPLKRLNPAAGMKTATIAPRTAYEEIYLIDQTSLSGNRGQRHFKIEAGSTYLYNLEFHHSKMDWLRMYANGGRFSVE